MASLVNPSNINGNFPIAGQDNDSQGFRDNFTNIRNNFTFIKSEVEDLQSKAVLKSALIGATLDNNFLGSQLKNAQLKNYSLTLYDWGNTSGEIQLDLALGNVHKLYTDGSININSVIKNWPSSLQYSTLLLYITISNTSHTLTFPNNITTSLEGLQGLRYVGSNNVVKYAESGTYVYEFSSVDSGTTVFIRELTRGNQLFRDPNFYFDELGAGSQSGTHPSGYETTTLKLNYGNVRSISSNVDAAKDNIDALSIKGAVSTYFGLNTSEGSNNSSLMKSAGYSVARSRAETPSDGTAVTLTSAEKLQTGDFVGYFNALGLTQALVGSTYPFQQLGAIQFYANGDQNSIGGNVIIATKQDGGSLAAALIIDNRQNVTIRGNLQVEGNTTILNTEILTVEDKNIVVAAGVASAVLANSAGLSVDTAFANIEYHGPTSSPAISTYGGGDRWISNKSFAVANSAASSSSSTGALVVAGGVGIGGDLNVGGNFGLTSSTNSTSKDSGAFVLTNGGLGVELNVVAGGGVFANTTNEAFNTISGGLVTAGGLGVAKVGFFGGNIFASADTESTGATVGSIITAGGVGIAKRLNVAGNVVVSSTANATYTMGTSGTTYSGALIVAGGAQVNKWLQVGNDAGDGGLIINVPTSALDAIEGQSDTGALIVGSTSAGKAGGMSVSGNFNLGADANGTLWIRSKLSAFGTVIDSVSRSPYDLKEGAYGSATVQGGVNIFGNLYVGQPHSINAGGALAYPLQNTGNIYIQSGTPSTSALTGAVVIQKVRLPSGYDPATSPDGFSYGGLGMQGNLYAAGNVILGGGGNGDAISNVVVDATTTVINSQQAALIVKGGLGVVGSQITDGNITITSRQSPVGHCLFSGTVTTAGGVLLTVSTITSGGMQNGMIVTGSGITGTVRVTAQLTSTTATIANPTATGSSGSNQIVVSSATSILVGQHISSATGVPNNTFVTEISGTTITLSNRLTASITTQTVVLTTAGREGTYSVTNSLAELVSSPTSLSATTPTNVGALVLTQGGIRAGGVSVFASNVLFTSGSTSTDTATGAMVITGTGGLAVGGATNLNGALTIQSATNATDSTGAVQIPNGGMRIGANLFVQGSAMPINAVGASGVALVSPTAANAAITAATATDIPNLNFTAEANKTYKFEAFIFHHVRHNNAVAAAITRGLTVTFSGGTCNYTIEQNNTYNGNLAITTTTGTGALISATSASMSSVTTPATLAQNVATVNMVAKVTGTFYHTAAVNVKLQAQVSGSAGTNTLEIAGHSYLKWTKLN